MTLRVSYTMNVSLVNITTERAALNKNPSRRRSNFVTLNRHRFDYIGAGHILKKKKKKKKKKTTIDRLS